MSGLSSNSAYISRKIVVITRYIFSLVKACFLALSSLDLYFRYEMVLITKKNNTGNSRPAMFLHSEWHVYALCANIFL